MRNWLNTFLVLLMAGLLLPMGTGCPADDDDDTTVGDDDTAVGDDDDTTVGDDDDTTVGDDDDDDDTTTGDDDDDDTAGLPECNGAPTVFAEMEPNNGESETDLNVVTTTDGDLTITGAATAGGQGGDSELFQLEFGCGGQADMALTWTGAGIDMDFYMATDITFDNMVAFSEEYGYEPPETDSQMIGGTMFLFISCYEATGADLPDWTFTIDWSATGDDDDDDSTGDDDDDDDDDNDSAGDDDDSAGDDDDSAGDDDDSAGDDDDDSAGDDDDSAGDDDSSVMGDDDSSR